MNRARSLVTFNVVLSVTVLMAVVCGCGERKSAAPSEKTAASAQSPRLRVSAAKPLYKSIRRSTTQPGQIEPFEQARLYAKIPAYVEKYHADIGDTVSGPRYDKEGKLLRRGQLLAELSAPEMDQELQQKRAFVAQAGADVEQAQAAVKVATANTASANARLKETLAAADRYAAEYERWTSEYDRVVQLVSKSAVPQKLADETKAQKLAADAARHEAQAKIESAQAAVAASQAQIEKSMADETAIRARRAVAEADEAHTAALIAYLRIEAPFDGTISERNADIGYFAQPGGGNQVAPMFTVVRADRVRVFVDLAEMDAPLADPGDRAVVRVQSLPGYDFPGTVTRTSWALDPTTRTLRVEVDVPNEDGKLRPGMYAQVNIDLAEKENTCVVPAAAVIDQDGGTWCLVVEDGKAIRKPVTVGLKSGNEVEIVSGLGGDELVILGKGASIVPGTAVELIETTKAR